MTVPFLHCRVDPRDLAIRQAIVGIDRRGLPDLNITSLGLGDLQLRLQLVWLHYLGQHGADRYVLAHRQRQIGQCSGNAGA